MPRSIILTGNRPDRKRGSGGATDRRPGARPIAAWAALPIAAWAALPIAA
jgi:hypothetical protein